MNRSRLSISINNNNIRLLKIDKPQFNTEMLKVTVIHAQYKHKQLK